MEQCGLEDGGARSLDRLERRRAGPQPALHCQQQLASKILGRCARQLPGDWERRYGYRPLLLETLVDGRRFAGTCYRAANWIPLGETQGRGRMDRYNQADGSARKLVLVYPLCPNVRQALREASPPRLSESGADGS